MLRVLSVTDHAYLPERAGGSEASTHELLLELAERGAKPAVVSLVGDDSAARRAKRLLRKVSGGRIFLFDNLVGYPVCRTWDVLGTIPLAIKHFRPNLILIQPSRQVHYARRILEFSIPTVVFLRDVDMKYLGGTPADLASGHVTYVANSPFVARRFNELFGVLPHVVTNIVRKERYLCANKTDDRITFINPVAEKGVDIAVGVARSMPDRNFLFVEGWPIPDAERAALFAELETLPNVELMPRQSDMRKVYERTKLLLVPSRCEEAWGRVVVEAQINGIPVVASPLGGLPDCVAQGGIVIDDIDNIAGWCDAVRSLIEDKAHYKKISVAAIENAEQIISQRRDTLKFIESLVSI